ncbi:MAG: protein phosphatase CheZ [Rhodocyclaceae bacterium]|nr:protein phosphatase CheZ [Rhodocyclaceae bacterium]
MTKPFKYDESGDSADLQALFDSIAAGNPPPAPSQEEEASGDSPELQALFDSIAAQAGASAPAAGTAAVSEDVFQRIGHLARKLHDALRELGYDKAIEQAAREIPDARDRLNYIARMTEQAAVKVLNACDIAKPALGEVERTGRELAQRWGQLFSGQIEIDDFKRLMRDSYAFFQSAPRHLATVNEQLNEIVLAQDFQDLTGQVIKKVIELVHNIETQLLQLLIETMPPEKRQEASGLMNGPVIDATRADVVTSQAQVDELLESLGF